ncbi:MAG TPA: transglutaminase-like domain-containing protein [Chitinophagaceae bacterium]
MHLKLFLFLLLLLTGTATTAQQPAVSVATDTAALDTRVFAHQIVAGATGNFAKARTLLHWLSTHFEWKATDYQKRTVKEIIVRKGGNCFELATVYMALLKELNLTYRPIAEINIHQFSERRGQSAAQKVTEAGNRMSVFGQQHNDHRWVEIWDDQTGEWVPADPTMNLIGVESWLKGRAWFGERRTLNEDISREMIVPFAVFVVDSHNKSRMLENRTQYYMVTRLDALYGNELSRLPSWKRWVSGLDTLSGAAKKAFAGEENLHRYNQQIGELAGVYQALKQEYAAGQKN